MESKERSARPMLARMRPAGLVAAAVLVAAAAGSTLAQGEVPTYPECAKKASADDLRAAKGAHEAASGFYDRADYDRAIRNWRDAYEFDCNAHRLLINIANAYEKKGDREAAVVTLEAYLKRVPSDDLIQVRTKNLRDAMKPQPSAAPTATPSVTATAAPTAAPTTSPTTAPPSGKRPHGSTPLIVAGAGAGVAVVGVILLGVGIGDMVSADASCPNKQCINQAAQDQGNRGVALASVGGVAVGLGGAAALGGLVWQFGFNKPKAEPAAARVKGLSAVRVVPALAPGHAGLSLHAKF
jgi:tetratricopeptide (TPR) repeat protein